MPSPERWVQRFESLARAVDVLRHNCAMPSYSDLERSGLIQNFEVAFELSWHTMKDYLFELGHDVRSPKPTIRTAADLGLIVDAEIWLDVLDKRNLFTHTYREELALAAVKLIKESYFPALSALAESLGRKVPN